MTTPFHLRPANPRDIPAILALIQALAEYEKLSHEVRATSEQLTQSLFGSPPGAEVVLGCADQEAVGFAVFFHSYSTFLGQRGLHLEDLFVLPAWRRRGLGQLLLRHVAGLAVARGCGRLEWSVLDWNEPARGFYLAHGAEAMQEWTVFRMTGQRLQRLAGIE